MQLSQNTIEKPLILHLKFKKDSTLARIISIKIKNVL